ncbi:paraquat-inducible protein A [Ahrensia sp. R2A130]|uniref:paraquat-inducible protein A n=1 Tax=Ahrensia sp. R2A130 TaxID=744979 RepID=UPI0018DCD05C|nr:paraquat-inducible protein A [Ahrensia sp. R2A130]
MRCVQCGYQLTLGQPEAIARVTGLAITSAILMFIVLFAPFLDLKAGSFNSNASVVDVILGFASGIMTPLAFAVLGFIVVLPLARALLLIYTLAPLVMGTANLPGARIALRWAFYLKPWAMAEIFMVGVAVALVKLAGMASIEMGTAFWAFSLLVAVNAFQDTFMCRNTLWTGLNTNIR